MKRRVAYLKIDDKIFGGVDSPLNISFDVTYLGNTLIPKDARFTIDNLSESDIKYITRNTDFYLNRLTTDEALKDGSKSAHIEFYCGYEGNVRKIFDGNVQKATPTGQPDTTVEITAWTTLDLMGRSIQVSMNKVSFYNLIDTAVDMCGFELSMSEELKNSTPMQQTIDNFSFTGSLLDFLFKAINAITGNNMIKDQIIFTIFCKVVYVGWLDKTNTTSGIKLINSQTGLVGIPEPTEIGIDLRTLIDVSIMPQNTIRLESKILSIYNGLYNVINTRYHGSTRENDYYMDLHCSRVIKGVDNV